MIQSHDSPPNPISSTHAGTHDMVPSWFERPGGVRLMIVGLVAACAVVTVADFFYENPHPHFAIETTFGFQAWFGFVAFAVIVFLGRAVRPIVSREEDYYEKKEHDGIDR